MPREVWNPNEEQWKTLLDGESDISPVAERRRFRRVSWLVFAISIVGVLALAGLFALVGDGGSASRPERRPAPVASTPSSAPTSETMANELTRELATGSPEKAVAMLKAFQAKYPACIFAVLGFSAGSPRSLGYQFDSAIEQLRANAPRGAPVFATVVLPQPGRAVKGVLMGASCV